MIMNILFHNNRLMHRTSLYCLLLFSFVLLISCDKGFREMNTNPNAFNEPVVNNLFARSIINVAGTADGNTQYPRDKIAGAIMQYWSSLNVMQWTGVFYMDKPEYTNGFFSSVYGTELQPVQQLLYLTKDDPELSNQYNILRIFRVYILHRCTDMYGDVPYFEAGQGYTEGLLKPKFDRQEDIYKDMLKELEEAANNLDDLKTPLPFGRADYIYGGDVTKWKKWAYSLMLRLGMRLTKVDPALAETWVKKAIAGGVMSSNADIPYLEHTAGTGTNYNQQTYRFNGPEVTPVSAQGTGYGKMGETFVTMLRETLDPRSPFYITLWQGNADVSQLAEYSRHEIQKGLPHGYDANSIKELYPEWTTNTYKEFSEVNLHTIGHMTAPTIFQHYSEVEYLLAEAALRGWTSGTPREYYEKGVNASMSVQSLYPGDFVISQSDIDDYLTRFPYKTDAGFEEEMEQIHTQFYLSNFLNGIEAWSNWRRVEYPTLVPTNYPGNQTGGTIPRRIPYLVSETTRNEANYKEALVNQRWEGDWWTSRIWWDKE